MNDNPFTPMYKFVIIGKDGEKFVSHGGIFCDHFTFFRTHQLVNTPLEIPEMTQRMFDALVSYSYTGCIPRFAFMPLLSIYRPPFHRDIDLEHFKEQSRDLRDLYYAVELFDEMPLMNKIMDEIQDSQAAANCVFSPETIREVYANTRRYSPSRLYALFTMRNEIEKGEEALYHRPYYIDEQTYADWPAYYNKNRDVDEIGPDYAFVCMKWEAENEFDPSTIDSRFGDFVCYFHDHNDLEEVGKCGPSYIL